MSIPQYSFFEDESGAVTVDWVVLTAAIVGLGIATYTVVGGGVSDASTDVSAFLEQDHITTTFAEATPEAAGFDMSTALLVGSSHSEAWRQDMINRFYPEMSQGQLDTYYQERINEYNSATSGYAHAIDHIGMAQAEYQRRELELPEGSPDYLAIRDAYVAENG